MKTPQVLVIGLDGATFDLIDPLMLAGKLPNIERLVKSGSRGTLRSCIPPISAPAWVTFMTGKDPSRHGVSGFYHFDPVAFSRGELPLTTSASIRSATLWDCLREADRKTIALNIPMTYPPLPVDGIMISGLGTPAHCQDFMYPKDLAPIVAQASGLSCRIVDPFTPRTADRAVQQTLLRDQLDLEGHRTDLALYLMGHYPWNLTMLVYTVSDRLQHFLWRDATAVESMYRTLDTQIGRLLEAIDDNTLVVLMSDHGFGPQEGSFATNAWLRQNGWLTPRRMRGFGRLRQFRLRTARRPLQNVLARLHLDRWIARLPSAWRLRSLRLPYVKRNEMALIDWEKTKAYGAAYGIRLNVMGREPHGIIAPGAEFEAVRNQIMQQLAECPDPVSGEPVVDMIARREDVYQGPYQSEFPDILFMVKGLAYIQTNRVDARSVFEPTFLEGNHRMDGILVVHGPGVRSGHPLPPSDLADVMPTLLHAMHLPVPDDLDGRVIESCFDSARPVRTCPAKPVDAPPGGAKPESGPGYAASEDAEIRQRLQDLGYVE